MSILVHRDAGACQWSELLDLPPFEGILIRILVDTGRECDAGRYSDGADRPSRQTQGAFVPRERSYKSGTMLSHC